MMKSLSNTFRKIALVILLLVWVVIITTCQGGLKGIDNGASARPSNPEGKGMAINFASDSTRGAQNLLSACAVCHLDESDAANWSIGSTNITIPALQTAVSAKMNWYGLSTELSQIILK